MCHCVSTASSRPVFGACTACALSVIVSIAFSRRLYGVATATIALPRASINNQTEIVNGERGHDLVWSVRVKG